MGNQELHSFHTAIVILAAGNSSRLGEPKQLLPFKNENLIRCAVREALAVPVSTTLVVLGAEANKIRAEIEEFPVEIIVNMQYQEGMASSIRCGVQYVMDRYPEMANIMIMLCDQPYVESWLLQALMNVKKEQMTTAIVASFYDGDYGVPAIFDRRVFPELLKLQGDKGAKSLMKHNLDRITGVPFPLGNIDIDTSEAFQKWI